MEEIMTNKTMTNDKKMTTKYAKPVWKRLVLPENLFPSISRTAVETLSLEGDGVEILPYDKVEKIDFDDTAFTKHLGDAFKTYIDAESNHGYIIKSKSRGLSAPSVKITYKLNADMVDNYLIIAEEGAKLDVYIDYGSDESTIDSPLEFPLESRQHYGTTRIIAKRGSTVRVIKVQRLGVADNHFDQNFSVVEEGANLALVDIQFGAGNKAIAYESHLKGRHSNTSIESLYFGDTGEQLDLSFTMKHFGAKSESTILSKGALSGNSKKVFRGNLFFEKGSIQSVGKEKEVVILLDEHVKSDSIPALLCSEDDVVGEHAASIGQLDTDKIFYLMSRGLSLEAAKRLVIKASFEEVLMRLNDETLKSSIEEALDRRLTSGFKL
jgi:Fe-S cluster assembly scaffold protein SufB